MVMDYSDIKKSIKPILENYLDHHHLNDTLAIDSPTSEYVAKWIYEKLKPELPQLAGVMVRETCTSSCLYHPIIKLV
jgi:6-pyruvoyltetrahydropterin/6-carboxytetrahydropterin synthase